MSRNADKVLLIEDTISIAMVFKTWLGKRAIQADIAQTGGEGLEKLRTGEYRAVLLDLQLPDMNGLDVLRKLTEEGIDVTAVVVTASGSIGTAVQAMRLGAYDFIVKPASEERLVTTVRNALERMVMRRTIKEVSTGLASQSNHGFIGTSLPMIAVYKTIEAVSRSNAAVFVLGESGTGKEVCASAIHMASPRRAGRFVALNCAAIPKDLIESEIFGHVKGAFTGATGDREGAAHAADGGTLFLDEICEMDISLQSKLLRFLQTGTVQKVGSDKTTKVDVRIVCATNRDPMEEVRQGRFREDLYYRLYVIPIEMPALRERDGDALLIAKHLLGQMSAEENKEFEGFTPDAEGMILAYAWPGNVRELQNVIRKAVILNDGPFIDGTMLAIGGNLHAVARKGAMAGGNGKADSNLISVDLNLPFHVIERQIIEEAIRRSGDSVPKASQTLELSPSTIYRKREGWEAA